MGKTWTCLLALGLVASPAQATCVDDAYATLHRLERSGIAESRLYYAIYHYPWLRDNEDHMVVILDGRWVYDTDSPHPSDIRHYHYRMKMILAPGTPLNQLPRHLGF